MSVAAVADELGTSPQNLNAKFNRKSIKIDFFQKIKEIIDRCAPPLPAEMEAAVIGSNVMARTVPMSPSRLLAMLPWLLRINCCENRMSSCKVKLKRCLQLSGKDKNH